MVLNHASGVNVTSVIDEHMHEYLYKTNANHLCEVHAKEFRYLFPSGKNVAFRFEFNAGERTIDYFSTAKLPNRMPERIFSIRLAPNNTYAVAAMLVAGQDAPASWAAHLVEKFADSAAVATPSAADLEMSMMLNENDQTPVKAYSRNSAAMDPSKYLMTPVSAEQTEHPSSSSVSYSAEVVAALRDMFFTQPVGAIAASPRTGMPRSTSFSSTRGRAVSNCSTTSMLPTPVILVSIEGNIGAGKSTVLNALRKKHPHWNYIDEPLDTWTSLKNEDGTNLLELFYNDQRRWSYTFQNCAVLSRFRNIEQAIQKKHSDAWDSNTPLKSNIFITERCLDTDYHVFAKMLHDDKMIDALEFSLYEKWFKLLKETATPLSAIVYIDTPPAVCDQRIKGRARDGEGGIPLDYLTRLTDFQNTWVDSLTGGDEVSNAYSPHSRTAFPCLKATEVEDIEKFILGLQVAGSNVPTCSSVPRTASVCSPSASSTSTGSSSPLHMSSVPLASFTPQSRPKGSSADENDNELLVMAMDSMGMGAGGCASPRNFGIADVQ